MGLTLSLLKFEHDSKFVEIYSFTDSRHLNHCLLAIIHSLLNFLLVESLFVEFHSQVVQFDSKFNLIWFPVCWNLLSVFNDSICRNFYFLFHSLLNLIPSCLRMIPSLLNLNLSLFNFMQRLFKFGLLKSHWSLLNLIPNFVEFNSQFKDYILLNLNPSLLKFDSELVEIGFPLNRI